jgi:DNA-directed RNA polymerase subunit RPC12/RpoP
MRSSNGLIKLVYDARAPRGKGTNMNYICEACSEEWEGEEYETRECPACGSMEIAHEVEIDLCAEPECPYHS